MRITILAMLYQNQIPISYHRLLFCGNSVVIAKNVKPYLVGNLKLKDAETSRYFETALDRQLGKSCVSSFHPSLTVTVDFRNVITYLIT